MRYANYQIKYGWLALYLILSMIFMMQLQVTPANISEIKTPEIQEFQPHVLDSKIAKPHLDDLYYSRSSSDEYVLKEGLLDRLESHEWQKLDELARTTYDLPVAPDVAFYTPHAPIIIEDNEDFAAWPGEGTSDTPYIISGLEIYITDEDACIKISNTDVYFEIRDCYLHSNSTEPTNIELYSVVNGLIINNTCADSNIGIFLNNTNSITVEDNTCTNQSRACIYLNESHDIMVDNNTIVQGWSGIYLEKSDYTTIKDNDVVNCQVGIDIYWSSDHNTIFRNDVINNLVCGIELYLDCTYNLIDNNTCIDNTGPGIDIHTADHNTVVDNYCNHNYGEISLTNFEACFVEGNYLKSSMGSEGLYLDNVNNTVIQDNTFYEIEFCLYMSHRCSNNLIQNNNFTFYDFGIMAGECNGLDIIDNDFDSFGHTAAVAVSDCSGVLVQNNYGTNSQFIFIAESSDHVQIINNRCENYESGIILGNTDHSFIEDNYCNIGSEGIGIYESYDAIVDNNTVTYNANGISFYGSILGFVTNNNCTTNDKGIYSEDSKELSVEDNLLHDYVKGIYFVSTNNSEILYNTVENGDTGILVESSFAIDIIGNDVFDNSDEKSGIHVSASEYVLISENNCTAATVPSIHIDISRYCTVTKNIITETIDGVVLTNTNHTVITENTITLGQGYGIGLWSSSFNTVNNNRVANISGWEGWALICDGINNTFTYNIGCNSTYGFWIEDALNCLLSHNILYGNKQAFRFDSTCENNTLTWNIFEDNLQNGTDNSIGAWIDYNYWSNYEGVDANGDGIGDTPHPIDGTALNNDTHPLVYYPTLPSWSEEPTDQIAEYGMDFSYKLSLTMTSKLAPISEWWLNGTDFVVDDGVITNVDAPAPGVYFLEIRAYNLYGFYLNGFFTIAVADTISPTIIGPDDFSYTVGARGHIITWDPSDLGPSSYSLSLDGVVVKSGIWNTTLENITYSADGLDIGEHTFILTVTDIGGNSASDSVVVTVVGGINTTMLLLAIGASGALLAVIVIVYLVRKKGTNT